MEQQYRLFFDIFHNITSIFGITLNILLLFVSITKSPTSIKSYSVLIVNFAITDLCASILSIFIKQRVIPVEHTLVHVSYGYCIYFGPHWCYSGYSMMLHFFIHSQWCLLLSFFYRFYILKNPAPKPSTVVAIILVVYIPSFVQFVSFIFTQGDPQFVFDLVHQHFPEYEFDISMVTGNINLLSPLSLFTIFHMTLPVFPINIIILILRSKIIHYLKSSTNHLQKNTKVLQYQLLKVLTYQSMLPSLLMCAVILFGIELFGILNHPIIEFSIFAMISFVPVFSPIIYLCYVTPYWKYITCKNSKVPVQNVNLKSVTTA